MALAMLTNSAFRAVGKGGWLLGSLETEEDARSMSMIPQGPDTDTLSGLFRVNTASSKIYSF